MEEITNEDKVIVYQYMLDNFYNREINGFGLCYLLKNACLNTVLKEIYKISYFPIYEKLLAIFTEIAEQRPVGIPEDSTYWFPFGGPDAQEKRKQIVINALNKVKDEINKTTNTTTED